MGRVALVLGGLAAGVLLAIGLSLVFADDAGDADGASFERRPLDELRFPPVDHDPAAATELVEAWARWRGATFVARGTWTRELDDPTQDVLAGGSYRVQDPPRRLVVRLGSTVERIDGDVSVCDSGDDSLVAPACTDGAGVLTYDERVAREMAVVAAYVEGPDRAYDAAAGPDDGCHRVELVAPALASPWGRWAEFCFDEATGALVSSVVRRASAVDTEQLRVVSDTVTDADFDPEE